VSTEISFIMSRLWLGAGRPPDVGSGMPDEKAYSTLPISLVSDLSSVYNNTQF
jgi:hypothetical protein